MTFPKEFNRNLLKSLDRRFLIVLLLILIAEPVTIFFLLLHSTPVTNEKEVERLQAKYADLFLSEFVVETPTPTAPQNELLLYASEYVDAIVGETFGKGVPGGASMPELRPGTGSRETRAASRAVSEARRRITAAARSRARENLGKEVGRIGLLGIITSGSALVSTEPVEQILEYSVSSAADLEKTLSEVQALRVPRLGVDYYGTAVGAGGWQHTGPQGVVLPERQVRGSRHTESGINPEDIVSALAEAPKKEVEANRLFEPVQAVPTLAGLRSRPEKGTASRDPQRMREIVMAHNAAIQDCYRRQLKHNPTVKGKVTVRLTVSHTGHVTQASVVASTIDLPELHACILKKIRRWNDFGAVDPSQEDITFRQTYVFGY